MKRTLILLAVIACFGCTKDEPKPLELKGTLWSRYSGLTVFDKEEIYEMIDFTSTTECKYYSAIKKSKLLGDISTMTYTFDGVNIVLKHPGGNNYIKHSQIGTVKDNRIIIEKYTFETKADAPVYETYNRE